MGVLSSLHEGLLTSVAGRLELQEGTALIRAGGHFEGGTVCHWAAGVGGAGALLTGDILTVVADRRWLGFMYSYPNLIPLSASKGRAGCRVGRALRVRAHLRCLVGRCHSVGR